MVVAASQVGAPGALSAELRADVRDGRFGLVTSIRGLPLGVRDALQTLFRSPTLDIAEPGGEFQRTGVSVNRTLPIRRLAAAGCTIDLCIVHYERGGDTHSWRVALFRWTPAETKFLWGGVAAGGHDTIDDVRNAILSGAINGSQVGF